MEVLAEEVAYSCSIMKWGWRECYFFLALNVYWKKWSGALEGSMHMSLF